MPKQISVNKHKIAHNIKHPEDMQPPIRVQEGKQIVYGTMLAIMGPSTLVYNPDKPLKCGARVWLETKSEIWLDTNQGYIQRFFDEYTG